LGSGVPDLLQITAQDLYTRKNPNGNHFLVEFLRDEAFA